MRPSGLIKRQRKMRAPLDKQILIKVENVSQERISEVDLNHYRILSKRRLLFPTASDYALYMCDPVCALLPKVTK
jgi:hypothetical protein